MCPLCFFAALHGEALKLVHGLGLEHEANPFTPEHEILEVWERCSADDGAFLGNILANMQCKVNQRGQPGKNLGTIFWQRDNLNFQASEAVELADPVFVDSGEGEPQHM